MSNLLITHCRVSTTQIRGQSGSYLQKRDGGGPIARPERRTLAPCKPVYFSTLGRRSVSGKTVSLNLFRPKPDALQIETNVLKLSPWTQRHRVVRAISWRHRSDRPLGQRTVTLGKYPCMADLEFILFGFCCFAYVELETVLLVWSNPKQSNRMSALHWYLNPSASFVWLSNGAF